MRGHDFWKAEVRGQASAASIASVARLVMRMFGFSAAQSVEGPMLSCLICGDQESGHRAPILLVLTVAGITWLFLVLVMLECFRTKAYIS